MFFLIIENAELIKYRSGRVNTKKKETAAYAEILNKARNNIIKEKFTKLKIYTSLMWFDDVVEQI